MKTYFNKTFAKKVAERLNAPKPPSVPQRVESRFYDVRPAKIVGDWERIASGVWAVDARFIVNETVDEIYVFSAFLFANAEPPALDRESANVVYVVWRGRWEVLNAPQTGLRFAKVTAAWTQNAARNAVLSAALNVDGSGAAISVLSPLSKSGDAFAVGTRIVVAEIGGLYYLIQAECD